MLKRKLILTIIFYCLLLGLSGTAPLLAQDAKVELFSAIKAGDVNKVRQVLTSKSDINVRGDAGATPLIAACQSGNIKIITLLLDKKADINAGNDKGFTALMTAAKAGHVEAVKLLVTKGADPDIKNDTGFTAFQIANAFGAEEVARLLQPQGTGSNPQEIEKKPSQSPAIAEVAGVDPKRKCLPIRSAPNSASTEVGCVRLGEKVGLTDTWTNNNWIMIDNPVVGWVPSNLLRMVSDTPAEVTTDKPAATRTQEKKRTREQPQAAEEPVRRQVIQQQEDPGGSGPPDDEVRPSPPPGGSSWWRR
jgi:hypothetical protein